jgi:hypothetical protein
MTATLDQRMNPVPNGTWVSESSDITGYIVGNEWLQFMPSPTDHVWKMRQPTGEPWMCRFRLSEENGQIRFHPTTHSSTEIRQRGWPISLESLPNDRLAVTHHGFRTIFRKIKD